VKRLLMVGISLLVIAGLGTTVLAKPSVVATHAILGEFTQIVGGELIEVTTIIPSGFCPAFYDLCPSDVAAVSRATMVLYSGIEPWMDSLLNAVGGTASVVLLTGEWNTPDAAAEKVDAIAAALSELLPGDAGIFAANATAYKTELALLGISLKAKAATLNVAAVPVISMAWQEMFVSWLGFDVVATYGIPGNLSLQDLVDLAAVGVSDEVAMVIDNLQSGVNFGAKLAREVDAIHVVLSNFPGAMPRTATVLDLFAQNAEALFSAVEPLS
jgi:ABC-type Zn uptake system ZnuABC Zn-binding protein ZnuA